jgi:two-component system chemotaxis response regulator CheY
MALNILVVDDSAVMRAMIIKTLRLCGLPLGEVHQAGNGLEGIEVLSGNPIDLALVDINMPVMDGEEMITKIREDPAMDQVSVLVVSTEGSDTRIARLRLKGASFVHKPFTPEMLREKIVGLTGVANEQQFSDGVAQSGGLDF